MCFPTLGEEPSLHKSPVPLTALFVVLLMVREEELLGFAISRPELKS